MRTLPTIASLLKANDCRSKIQNEHALEHFGTREVGWSWGGGRVTPKLPGFVVCHGLPTQHGCSVELGVLVVFF